MDPATIAAIASIGGAAIDFFSGERSARKARKHTKQVATDEAFGSVMGRVEAAKAAGLHPLAGLGAPSSSGMSAGGGLTDFRSAVSDINNSYTQQRQWKAEQEYQRAAASEQKNAAQAAADRENARLKLEASRVTSQNAVDFEQIRASQEESIRRNLAQTKALKVPLPSKTKVGKEIPTQFIDVRDRFGNVIQVANPDLYDMELPETYGTGTLAYPEMTNPGGYGNQFLQDLKKTKVRIKLDPRDWFNKRRSSPRHRDPGGR